MAGVSEDPSAVTLAPRRATGTPSGEVRAGSLKIHQAGFCSLPDVVDDQIVAVGIVAFQIVQESMQSVGANLQFGSGYVTADCMVPVQSPKHPFHVETAFKDDSWPQVWTYSIEYQGRVVRERGKFLRQCRDDFLLRAVRLRPVSRDDIEDQEATDTQHRDANGKDPGTPTGVWDESSCQADDHREGRRSSQAKSDCNTVSDTGGCHVSREVRAEGGIADPV